MRCCIQTCMDNVICMSCTMSSSRDVIKEGKRPSVEIATDVLTLKTFAIARDTISSMCQCHARNFLLQRLQLNTRLRSGVEARVGRVEETTRRCADSSEQADVQTYSTLYCQMVIPILHFNCHNLHTYLF